MCLDMEKSQQSYCVLWDIYESSLRFAVKVFCPLDEKFHPLDEYDMTLSWLQVP
jgi:hypothetical protein